MGDTISQSIRNVGELVKSQGEKIEALETKLQSIENKLSQHLEIIKKSTKVTVPKFLQKRIVRTYGLCPEEEKWDLLEQWNSEVNGNITDQILADIHAQLKGKQPEDVILAGLKTHFTSIKRLLDSDHMALFIKLKLMKRLKKKSEPRQKMINLDLSVLSNVTKQNDFCGN
uniref:Uncharacterized protein n=1 Tax=Clytia hemisphaerica TaxID=252671 RepID=A0A7M5XLM2_9CNID